MIMLFMSDRCRWPARIIISWTSPIHLGGVIPRILSAPLSIIQERLQHPSGGLQNVNYTGGWEKTKRVELWVNCWKAAGNQRNMICVLISSNINDPRKTALFYPPLKPTYSFRFCKNGRLSICIASFGEY